MSLQVKPRQIVRKRESLGPQIPYLHGSKVRSPRASKDGSGVGFDSDDYQQELASAYPRLHLAQFGTFDAMRDFKSAIDRHTASEGAMEKDPFLAGRCHDPAAISYWAANPGCRVVRV